MRGLAIFWEEKLIKLFLLKSLNLPLVQIYVDDIIFGATNDCLCEEFVMTM